MAKEAQLFLETDPWIIKELGFHKKHSRTAESLFSLGNEYMGMRGYFEEGYGGDQLVGAYFNGVYEYHDVEWHSLYTFKGLLSQSHFMVNTLDWLYTRITIDGELLDLAKSKFSNFERSLDLREGVLRRSFTWELADGKQTEVAFEKMLHMDKPNMCYHRMSLTALNHSSVAKIDIGLDFSIIHTIEDKNFWNIESKDFSEGGASILGQTLTSGQRILSKMSWSSNSDLESTPLENEKLAGNTISAVLPEGQAVVIDRAVFNYAEKDSTVTTEELLEKANSIHGESKSTDFDEAVVEQIAHWSTVWEDVDIYIEGDPMTQQGYRFCIFHLYQTYHGVDPTLNISAKGLTGEAYSGWTWWDTETYCLPFYMFTNPKAAKNLLSYRHSTLAGALKRAKELDCVGARFPMTTINGEEACTVWQHGDLEIHVSAAIAYGIWHYDKVIGDKEFLYSKGIELLIEIARYYASRGDWGQLTGKYGYYGVMGADEFHMMVHNNCYTNVMAKKSFEYAQAVIDEMRSSCGDKLEAVMSKFDVKDEELADWRNKAVNMKVPKDEKTGVYEQHDGFFDLPHIDTDKIPADQFPLYHNWAYIRIFRYDMIKQPDVLLLPFFFSNEYTMEEKRVNYEYYEARCSHESSLSPGIHSILATELDMHQKAFDYTGHAARLDLDNYNRNTEQGVHTTSMAAAWMNVTYGFGGMRSDGDKLSFNPSLPAKWDSFGFKIRYQESTIEVIINKQTASLKVVKGEPVDVKVFNEDRTINSAGISISMPANRLG